MGSTQAVSKLRFLFQAKKAGHAGTLDPLAEGVLPIAFGEATKTIPYVQNSQKHYQFTLKWGEARTTDDLEGEITDKSDMRPNRQDIEEGLKVFQGCIMQRPPKFSAIKYKGERAYALARAGKEAVLKEREVKIIKFTLIDMIDIHHACFEVICSKGTYIRALARDLAINLGGFAYVTQLKRIATGVFHEKTAIGLEKFEDLVHITPIGERTDTNNEIGSCVLDKFLLPLTTVLDDIPAFEVNVKETEDIKFGRSVKVCDKTFLKYDYDGVSNHILAIENQIPIALGNIKKRQEEYVFFPNKVFNL